MLSWPKKMFLAFCLGLLTFTPWEIIMVKLGVVEFAYPNYLGLPWWIPLTFGLVVLGCVLLFTMADYLFKIQLNFNPNWLAFEYVLISLFYLSIFFFRQYPYLLSLGLFFVVLVRLIFFHEEMDFLFFVFGACVGPTAEIILISLGLFSFSDPDFMGMPFWLPVFWGNVALALRRVAWVLTPRPVPGPPGQGGLKGV